MPEKQSCLCLVSVMVALQEKEARLCPSGRRRFKVDGANRTVRTSDNPIDKWDYPFYFPTMKAKVTVDGAGRVLIPKQLRDDMRLEAGDELLLEADGTSVTLRPVRSDSAMRKESGIWVFRSGQTISADETDRVLEDLRQSRGRSLRDQV